MNFHSGRALKVNSNLNQLLKGIHILSETGYAHAESLTGPSHHDHLSAMLVDRRLSGIYLRFSELILMT
jgi:hypothetical protein